MSGNSKDDDALGESFQDYTRVQYFEDFLRNTEFLSRNHSANS